MHLLFVYGTLKRGCKNNAQMSGQRYVGDATTGPGYRLHHLGDYPGMVFDAAARTPIKGEIWAVDDQALARLDDFEGVDEGLYRRAPLETTPSFDQQPVYTYLFLRDLNGAPDIGPEWTE